MHIPAEELEIDIEELYRAAHAEDVPPLALLQRDIARFTSTPEHHRLPPLNAETSPAVLIDFDELDEVEQLRPDAFHDVFSSYLGEGAHGIHVATPRG